MTATETHASASVEKTGFEGGCMEDSTVANKLGPLMLSTDKIRNDRLVDQLSTMDQRPPPIITLYLLPRASCSTGGSGPI